MTKLTEIMKQIPLDELTGDVDMKERNNITVSKSSSGARVKRTGAFVAAAACAAVAIGATFMVLKNTGTKPEKQEGAADIVSAAASKPGTQDPALETGMDLYSKYYTECGYTGDMGKIFPRPVLEANTDNTIGTLGSAKLRLLGTRALGRVIRVDLLAEYTGSSFLPEGEMLEYEKFQISERVEEGDPVAIGFNTYESKQIETVDLGSGKAIISVVFSDRMPEDNAVGWQFTTVGGLRLGDDRCDIDTTVVIDSGKYSYTLETSVKTGADGVLPDMELREFKYSELGAEFTVYMTENGAPVSEERRVEALERINQYQNEYAPIVRGLRSDESEIFICGARAKSNITAIEGANDGEVIIISDHGSNPVDLSDLTVFTFGLSNAKFGQGVPAEKEPESSAPDTPTSDNSVSDSSAADGNDKSGYFIIPSVNSVQTAKAANIPVQGKWGTQYKGEDMTAGYEVTDFELVGTKLSFHIRFLSDECRYEYGDESTVDKDARSAAFYLPYFRDENDMAFISVKDNSGQRKAVETKYITSEDGRDQDLKNVFLIEADLSDVIPDSPDGAITSVFIGSAEITFAE